LRVEVDQEPASNPPRSGKFVVRVLLSADLPAESMALLERVARSCPAHNTLSLGADVRVTITVGDEEGAVPAR
jgi:hypothetical protein